MNTCYFLQPGETGLLVIDCQEKLFPLVDHPNETLFGILRLIEGFKRLELPVSVSEQYVKGLGITLPQVTQALGPDYRPEEKTRFSCGDLSLLQNSSVKNWVLCGIEAHVCVFQTAKDLTLMGKRVVVANDAISSRSVYDFSTAIAEMKEWCRISSVETILYELIRDANYPNFKKCLELFKEPPQSTSCGC